MARMKRLEKSLVAILRSLAVCIRSVNMRNRLTACVIVVLLISSAAQAQEAEIDSSKPTNFYSFLDNTFEYQRVDEETSLVGYRGNVTLALSAAHLLLAEVPLLRNTKTQKFGVGDVRARYFYLPYKNDNRFFAAFGPSVDVFMPTGSFDDGLGSSSWVVSPGVTVGLMIANWIQAFPVVSYTYTSKPDTDSIPEDRPARFQYPVAHSDRLQRVVLHPVHADLLGAEHRGDQHGPVLAGAVRVVRVDAHAATDWVLEGRAHG